jgi:hypothetical protein
MDATQPRQWQKRNTVRLEVRGEPHERGSYVRLWAGGAGGRWWLVAEVTELAS